MGRRGPRCGLASCAGPYRDRRGFGHGREAFFSNKENFAKLFLAVGEVPLNGARQPEDYLRLGYAIGLPKVPDEAL